ncbi:MAG: hypothetical protein JRE01_02215, partial [Deltaproteobacteria bacterium]|nr:hypothetical protein [Deltaproteobacteria bacterium]
TAGWTSCGNCHSDPPPLVDNIDAKVHNACGSCNDADGGLISTAIGKDFTTGGNCETCHGATWDTIHTTAPDHTSLVQVATTDCASCHSTPPPLVDNADPKVHNACASCHDATSGALISSAIGKDFTTGGDCTTCHGTAWESLHFTNNNGTTTHNSLVTVTATTAGWTNCASCHSDPPPLTDGADAKVHNACASCHATNGSRVSTAVGKDFTTGGNCETCHGTVADSTAFASTHTTHTASHTVSVGGDQSNGQLCSNCHVVSTWAEIEGTEHNVATNGSGSCATCHNSSTQTVIDVIAAGAATTCLDCHTDKTAAHGSVDHVATTYVTVGGTQEYYGTTCASCHDPGGAENATVDVTHGGDCSLCHTTVPNLQPGLPTGGGPNDCVNCHTGGVHTLWGRFQDTCAGDYGPESCHATFQGPGTSVHDAHNVNWDTPADDEIDRANATVGVDDQPMVFPYGTAPDYWQPNWPLTPTCGTCHTSYSNPLVTADGVGCNVCHKFKTNKKEFMHTYHEGDMAIDCQYCHYND